MKFSASEIVLPVVPDALEGLGVIQASACAMTWCCLVSAFATDGDTGSTYHHILRCKIDQFGHGYCVLLHNYRGLLDDFLAVHDVQATLGGSADATA